MTKLSMSEEEMLKRKYTRPYEKRIADLEKENADLKEEINKIAFARGNLEEENAELKEKVNILDNCDRLGDVITEAYKEQLTKAKEIIKNLLECDGTCEDCKVTGNLCDKWIAEAEQFISEVEK